MTGPLCPNCGEAFPPGEGVCPRCATQVRRADDGADSGRQHAFPEIPGYRIEGHLGEGGMGSVYVAEETALGRRVAIKMVLRRVAGDDETRSRFLREARTLATIEHPHVVRVYSFGETAGGDAYLVMELVDGETLGDRIVRMGRLPVPEALRITRQIAEALEAAWERKVVHRDIKPSNVLIDRRNQIRVADFGLAKPVSFGKDASLTQQGYLLGTPHYISPEQAQGADTDFRSDLYSLGIMLYQMVTGERPFDGTSPIEVVTKHLHTPMPSLRLRRPDAPEALTSLIAWMTQKDPARRPESCAHLIAAIDSLGGGPATPDPASMPTIALASTPSRSWRSLARIDLTAVSWQKQLAIGAVALVIVLFLLTSLVKVFTRKTPEVKAVPPDGRLIVAVTPFYGPDDDSAKEGRVMAALIERAVDQRLGRANARVIGIDETKSPVRDHDAARSLGTKLGAHAVIWGEAFALRKETEIQPHVTVIRPAASGEKTAEKKEERASASDAARFTEDLAALDERAGSTVRLQAEAPNQIELRKTSASGVGDIVVLLAGIHALQRQKDPAKALTFFGALPQSAVTLRYETEALLELGRNEEAIPKLLEAIRMEPNHAPSRALLGDLYLTEGKFAQAVSQYSAADATGAEYSSNRAFLDRGVLYQKETYRSKRYAVGSGRDGEMETNYLIGVDPSTQVVVARFSLPGVIRRITRRGEEFVIHYQVRTSDSDFAELVFHKGRFDRPLWPPADFRVRLRSMRSGRPLAANFMDQFERPLTLASHRPARFVLNESRERTSDAPDSLPALEQELRAAIVRDPTQPWHLFFLAMTLRETGRGKEAESLIAEIAAREWPGIPYYDFTRMMEIAERARFYGWADAIYRKAVAARQRVPQPVLFSTLIERLINTPFVRPAALNRDGERGYVGLQRARALGGITEFDEYGSAVWRQYFRERGDRTRETAESETLSRSWKHPLSFVRRIVLLDYSIVAVFAATFTYAILLGGTYSTALVRARRARPAQRPGVVRTMIVIAVAITIALLIAMTIGLQTDDSPPRNVAAMAGITFVLGYLFIRLAGVTFRDLIRAVGSRQRRVLAVSGVLMALTFLTIVSALLRDRAQQNIPLPIADAIGHEATVREFEQRLTRSPDRLATVYMAALSNHYAGNLARAGSLYEGLAGDERAAKNLAAARSEKPPVVPLEATDLAEALISDTWRRSIMKPPEDVAAVSLLVLALVLPLFPLPFIRSGPELPAGRPRWWKTAAHLLLPGVRDLETGHVWRAFAALLMIGIVILPTVAWVEIGSRPLVVSMLDIAVPNLDVSMPVPAAPGVKAFEFYRDVFRSTIPGTRIFWTLYVISMAGAIGLHALTVAAVVRRGAPAFRDENAAVTAPEAAGE